MRFDGADIIKGGKIPQLFKSSKKAMHFVCWTVDQVEKYVLFRVFHVVLLRNQLKILTQISCLTKSNAKRR